MMDSISTIFTMDNVKLHIAPKPSEKSLVGIGRVSSFASLVNALFLASPLLGNSPQGFENIQNRTGFFTPGVVAICFLGMYWRRETSIYPA